MWFCKGAHVCSAACSIIMMCIIMLCIIMLCTVPVPACRRSLWWRLTWSHFLLLSEDKSRECDRANLRQLSCLKTRELHI